ncbi:MAG TPA: ABC transporter permease [Actinomycetes bacterium]|nr:ABC transporter permease [Actinomycetes bacterium]
MTDGFGRIVRAEWTKFWSVRGIRWSLLIAVAVTIALTVLLASAGDTNATQAGQGDDDVVVNSLRGVYFGQLAVITLGVLAGTSEYATGLIRTTFAAVPARSRVLAAKAVVLGTAVAAAGLVASFASFLLAQPLLRGNGYVAPAYPPPSLLTEPVLRAIVGSGLFLALLALLGLGLGIILRRTGGAITALVAVTFVPLFAAEPGSPLLSEDVAMWVRRTAPMAGLAIQQTRDPANIAIGPWAGLGVLCGYVAVALVVAGWLLSRRDA